MKTDNMSILGLTIDYGPYGWLEGYDLLWTPNTTDAHGRRYCYGRQPQIALWNLARLAELGGYSEFEIANPPQSEVSWTSIATGLDPGEHGMFDFVHRDPARYIPFARSARHLALLARRGEQPVVALVARDRCALSHGTSLAGEPNDDVAFDDVTPVAVADAPAGLDEAALVAFGATVRATQMAGARRALRARTASWKRCPPGLGMAIRSISLPAGRGRCRSGRCRSRGENQCSSRGTAARRPLNHQTAASFTTRRSRRWGRGSGAFRPVAATKNGYWNLSGSATGLSPIAAFTSSTSTW